MTSQYLTCAFKLHNPSAHKRAVMDYAIEEYTRAYAELLESATEISDVIFEEGIDKRGEYSGNVIAGLLSRPSVGLHSSAANSLLRDAGGNLASYCALIASGYDATAWPVGRDTSPEAVDNALEYFIAVGSDNDDYNTSKAQYLKQARGRLSPFYFSRADAASQTRAGASRNRNFSLLSDADGRLFAVLYLLPARHELCKPLGATQGNLYRLDTGEVFKSNSSTAILVPLQIGRNGWQLEKFLNPAREQDGVRIKTGYLIKDERAGEYYLHVAFEFVCEKRYKPAAWVGVDKGILFTAAYAVVDTSGAVLSIGHFNDALRSLQIKHGHERERMQRNGKRVTKRHYRKQAYDSILHTLANELIDMARTHQAGICVEDLNITVKGGRVVSRFRKFDKIMAYKCKLAGVPFRSVFASYSSIICHKCGEDVVRDDRHIEYPACGYVGHSDDNAAVNIARRAMYRKKEWNGYREFHRSFADV